MARVDREELTQLSDREIAGTGIGTSPAAVAAYSDLQRAVYQLQPQDTAEVEAAAAAADTKAAGAQTAADSAQASAADAGARADDAGGRADTAQARADDAYDLAGTKVSKDATPAWALPGGSVSRAALVDYTAATAAVAYDAAQIQALMAQVQVLTRTVAALVTDLAGIDALKT